MTPDRATRRKRRRIRLAIRRTSALKVFFYLVNARSPLKKQKKTVSSSPQQPKRPFQKSLRTVYHEKKCSNDWFDRYKKADQQVKDLEAKVATLEGGSENE